MSNIVTLDKVSKTHRVRSGLFGSVTSHDALKGVSLQIEKGECVGLLGPNGAGKSTLIKILTGLMKPCSGTVTVLGGDPSLQSTAFLRSLGAVFGHKCSLWWDLPLRRSFENFGMIYGVPSGEFDSRLETLVSALSLKSVLNRPVRQLSLGESVKSEIVSALIHRPSLVFLDEPTIGLDVVSKDELRRFIAEIGSAWGGTVLLTSHDLTDIERCCRRTMFLDKGRLQFDGNLEEFRKWLASYGEATTSDSLEDLLVAFFRQRENEK